MQDEIIDEDLPFTICQNKIIQDENLSYAAVGIFIYLKSRPKDWKVVVWHLRKRNNTSEYAVRNALRELRDAGYMKWVRVQSGCKYYISGDAKYKNDIQHDEVQCVDIQHDEVKHDIYIQNKEINKTKTAQNKDNKKEASLQKKEETSEAIPTCIDSDTWEEWKHYRHKEKKQKLTPSTTQKQLQQLQKWHSEGHDPNEIINCSIMNGWSGLFPPKDKQVKKDNSTVKDSNQDHLDKKVEKLITEIKSQLLEYPDDFYNRSAQLKRTAEDWKIIENNSKIHEKYNIKDYRFVLDYILEIKQPCGKKGVPRAEFMSSYKNEFINMYGESSALALYNYFIATKDEKFFPSIEDYGK